MMVADLFANLSLRPDSGSFNVGDRLIGSIKKGLGGIAAFFAVRAIEEGITSVIDYGSAVNDTAQKTGMGAEALQFYGYVAKQNSSSMDDLASASVKLSKELGAVAKTGTGPALDGLQALHLSFEQINKGTPEERFRTIANAFVKLGPEANKQAIAMNLFGKSGAALIPTLNDLGTNGDALAKEFSDLGVAIDDGSVKSLDDLGDNIDKAKAQLGGLRNQLVVAMLPALSDALKGMLAWAKANKEVIASGIKTFVEGLFTAFHAVAVVIGVVSDAVSVLSDLVHAAFDGDTGAQALLIGVAAVIAALLIPLLVSVGIEMISIAASVVIATFPFFVLAAAVAAVAYGVLQLVKHWDVVSAAVSRVGHRIWDFFRGIGSGIYGVISGVVNWVVDKIRWLEEKVGAIVDAVRGAIDAVENAPKSIWSGIKNTAVDAASGVANFVSPNAGNTTNGGDTNVTNNVTVNAPNADAKQVGSAVATAIDDHWKAQMRGAKAGTGGSDQ